MHFESESFFSIYWTQPEIPISDQLLLGRKYDLLLHKKEKQFDDYGVELYLKCAIQGALGFIKRPKLEKLSAGDNSDCRKMFTMGINLTPD